MFLVLSNLIQRFRFSKVSDEDVLDFTGVTGITTSACPYRLKVEDRHHWLLSQRTGTTDYYPQRSTASLTTLKGPRITDYYPQRTSHHWLLPPKDPASLTSTPKGPSHHWLLPPKDPASLTSTPKGHRITDYYPQRTAHHWLQSPKDPASPNTTSKGLLASLGTEQRVTF